MGLYEKLFPRQAANDVTAGYFDTLTAYQPVFRSFAGGLYEAELCRACVHAIANHASKLKPVIKGARKDLQNILEYQPNPWQDTTKFIYQIVTILECENTAFIVPMYDEYYQKVIGFYPVRPSAAEVRQGKNGAPYLVFTFNGGKRAAIELDRVGIMTKFLYKQAFFGENNSAIMDTVDLIFTEKQGMSEGIKQSATIRFMGKLAQALKPSDIEAERKRWREGNLSLSNSGGIALFDTKYSEVKQIDSKPYIVSAEQKAEIDSNCYTYFGVNKKILQNEFDADTWAAFYEGKIEPIALQLSLVLTNMLFSAEQKTRGNAVYFTSNRLQYATTAEKLNVVVSMRDRGAMSRNEMRDVFNLEPLDDGDDYVIRGEYYAVDDKLEGSNNEQNNNGQD